MCGCCACAYCFNRITLCVKILLIFLHAFAEAERIRNQYSEATTKLATVQHQISELESKLKGDFGRSWFLTWFWLVGYDDDETVM